MSISLGKLKNLVMRLEALEDQKSQLMEDIRETFAEAKGEGFDVKVLRRVLRVRKMKPEELSEEEELLEVYLAALRGGGDAASGV